MAIDSDRTPSARKGIQEIEGREHVKSNPAESQFEERSKCLQGYIKSSIKNGGSDDDFKSNS